MISSVGPTRRDWTWLLAVLAMCGVVYLPALQAGFVVDDIPVVRDNPYVHSWSHVGRFFTHSTWANTALQAEGGPVYRPLLLLGFTAQYSAWGDWAAAYHAFALALHLAATALVFLAARRLFDAPPLLAALGAALFAWHPTRVESVAWIAAENDAMCAVFLLGALLAHRRHSLGGGWWWLAVSLAGFTLAMFSKEAALFFPLIVLAHDRWLAGRVRWPVLAAFAGVAALYLALRAEALSRADAVVGWSADTPSRVVDFLLGYMELMGLPREVPFHLVPPESAVGGVQGILTALMGAAIIVWLLRDHDRTRLRQARFSLAWLALSCWPLLVLALYQQGYFSARHLYLPAIGLAWCATLALRRLDRSRLQAPAFALVALVLAAHLLVTRAEIRQWRDDAAVYGEVARLAPNSPVGPLGVARHNFERDDYAAARPLYEAALRLTKTAADRVYPLEALGTIAGMAQDLHSAEAYFNEAVQIDPNTVDAWVGLGNVAWIKGALDQAIFYYEKAHRLRPNHAEVVANLIAVYERTGQVERARQLRVQQARATRGESVTRLPPR